MPVLQNHAPSIGLSLPCLFFQPLRRYAPAIQHCACQHWFFRPGMHNRHGWDWDGLKLNQRIVFTSPIIYCNQTQLRVLPHQGLLVWDGPKRKRVVAIAMTPNQVDLVVRRMIAIGVPKETRFEAGMFLHCLIHKFRFMSFGVVVEADFPHVLRNLFSWY